MTKDDRTERLKEEIKSVKVFMVIYQIFLNHFRRNFCSGMRDNRETIGCEMMEKRADVELIKVVFYILF